MGEGTVFRSPGGVIRGGGLAPYLSKTSSTNLGVSEYNLQLDVGSRNIKFVIHTLMQEISKVFK